MDGKCYGCTSDGGCALMPLTKKGISATATGCKCYTCNTEKNMCELVLDGSGDSTWANCLSSCNSTTPYYSTACKPGPVPKSKQTGLVIGIVVAIVVIIILVCVGVAAHKKKTIIEEDATGQEPEQVQ